MESDAKWFLEHVSPNWWTSQSFHQWDPLGFMHTLHASRGWGQRSMPCPLPCHLLATGDKLPWSYLLQWLLAAGPHLHYKFYVEFWNSTLNWVNGLQIYGQQRHSFTSRFIFACISSALFHGDATVDALLEEFSRQAEHLFFNGFLETCCCLTRFFPLTVFQYKGLPGNSSGHSLSLAFWPLRIIAVTAFISSPWDAKATGHGCERLFGLGWVPFALRAFFRNPKKYGIQKTQG